MCSMLTDAFDMGLSIVEKDATWIRPSEVLTYPIKVSLSNYSRNMLGPEEITMTGREFVVSKRRLENIVFYPMVRGDIIVVDEYGDNHVTDVREMPGLNGEVLGFRVRTD